MRRLSDRGLALVRRFEGLECAAYRDVAGVWTVGYGHTGPRAGPGLSVTEAEAEALLRQDAARIERAVSRLVREDTTQSQFDALASLAFNIGEAAFAASSVLARHDEGASPEEVAEAFGWWNKATIGGVKRVVPGLVRRREAEAALYGAEDDAPADAPRTS